MQRGTKHPCLGHCLVVTPYAAGDAQCQPAPAVLGLTEIAWADSEEPATLEAGYAGSRLRAGQGGGCAVYELVVDERGDLESGWQEAVGGE